MVIDLFHFDLSRLTPPLHLYRGRGSITSSSGVYSLLSVAISFVLLECVSLSFFVSLFTHIFLFFSIFYSCTFVSSYCKRKIPIAIRSCWWMCVWVYVLLFFHLFSYVVFKRMLMNKVYLCLLDIHLLIWSLFTTPVIVFLEKETIFYVIMWGNRSVCSDLLPCKLSVDVMCFFEITLNL